MSLRAWLEAIGGTGPVYRTGGFDVVKIAGTQIPGEVVAEGGIKAKKDEKKAAGKNGGHPTVHGQDGQGVKIVIRLWTPEQYDAFDRDFKEILRFIGYADKAYAIEAAALSDIGVKAITIDGATSWKKTTMSGGSRCAEMTLDCKHWINDQAPKSVTKNVKTKYREPPKSERDRQKLIEQNKPSGQPEMFTITEDN